MCGRRRNPTAVLALVLFAASLVVGTLAPPGPQGESAITAWWKLDEGTGTNVLDSFLNGRDGVFGRQQAFNGLDHGSAFQRRDIVQVGILARRERATMNNGTFKTPV